MSTTRFLLFCTSELSHFRMSSEHRYVFSHLGTGLSVPSQYKSVLAFAPIHEQTFQLLYYCTIWDLPRAASATHTVRLKTQKFPVKGLQQRLCAVWGCTVMARDNLYGALQQHVGGWEMEDLIIMRKRNWLFVGVRESNCLTNTETYRIFS